VLSALARASGDGPKAETALETRKFIGPLGAGLSTIGLAALAYLGWSFVGLRSWRKGLPFEVDLAGWSALVDRHHISFLVATAGLGAVPNCLIRRLVELSKFRMTV
jgi:hypothetical protein